MLAGQKVRRLSEAALAIAIITPAHEGPSRPTYIHPRDHAAKCVDDKVDDRAADGAGAVET